MNFQRPSSSRSFAKRSLASLGLGATLLLAPLGCQPLLLPEEGGPPTSTSRQGLRIANSLTTQDLVLNAISTNPESLHLLVGDGLVPLFHPLTGSEYLGQQLKDMAAQHFMAYLVGCALEEGSSVDWMDPLTETVRTWEGKAGLCPDWESGAPSEECKHRVSACLLARNNALGRRVELSVRGEDPLRPALFGLESETRPVEHDPDLGGLRVPSYEACVAEESGGSRDCGWTGDFIGRCQPGQPVRLGAGGKAPDQCGLEAVLGWASDTRMMLRVCAGLLGCDSFSERNLAWSEGSCGTTGPAVTFTCPTSGHFNVMAAPYDSTQTGTVTVKVETGTPAATSYKLSEGAVFRLREGAYYGTVFDPKALAVTVFVDSDGHVLGKSQVVTGPVYRRMYSCQAPEWYDGLAYATNRLCAVPGSGSNCAAHVTGKCIDPVNRSFPASKCLEEDGLLVSGDGDFEQCYDPQKGLWQEPITVYLHQPCDLMRPGAPNETCLWRTPRSR
ncbi:hypothetical protein [Archangium sp.]|uniref:hypothetical protein n=1 Tax=Archangium sp. TaxID=1872627 RepID=UPI00286A5E57|nr:hypothetical protein [Archangium sp.]